MLIRRVYGCNDIYKKDTNMERIAVCNEAKRTSGNISGLKKSSKQSSGTGSIDYDDRVRRIQFEITRVLLAEMTQ